MQVSNIIKIVFSLIVISALSALIAFAEDSAEAPVEVYSAETVSVENGLLSINAKNMRPEDLIKEVSEKCKIELVVLGEVFPDSPVSMSFKDIPVHEGIKRVLRRAGITKHLMHFKAGDNKRKIVRLDLIGDKSVENNRLSR